MVVAGMSEHWELDHLDIIMRGSQGQREVIVRILPTWGGSVEHERAARIMTAVNSHQQLVEADAALRERVKELERDYTRSQSRLRDALNQLGAYDAFLVLSGPVEYLAVQNASQPIMVPKPDTLRAIIDKVSTLTAQLAERDAEIVRLTKERQL